VILTRSWWATFHQTQAGFIKLSIYGASMMTLTGVHIGHVCLLMMILWLSLRN
jgi:hypothetical protein